MPRRGGRHLSGQHSLDGSGICRPQASQCAGCKADRGPRRGRTRMVKQTVQPRGTRLLPFLGGVIGALGLAALAAAVAPLGPPLDFRAVDTASLSGASPALASQSIGLAGPLYIPSIGVVAPGLDAFAALNGPQPPVA